MTDAVTTYTGTTIDLNDDRIKLLRETIGNGAPPLEFDLFVNICKRTGLDPFAGQIHLVKRGNQWSWQTSIDGYRLIADRTGNYAGSDVPVYTEPPGQSENDPRAHPNTATVTVWKLVQGQRVPFTAVARWSEYAVYVNDRESGQRVLNTFWQRMPYLMLAKCAESLALRKAFPAELSTLYTREEMMQVDNTPVGPGPEPPPAATTNGAPPAEPQAAEVGEAQAMTDKQRKFIFALANQAGIAKDDLDAMATDRHGTRVSGLTRQQAIQFLDFLTEFEATPPPAPTPTTPPPAPAATAAAPTTIQEKSRQLLADQVAAARAAAAAPPPQPEIYVDPITQERVEVVEAAHTVLDPPDAPTSPQAAHPPGDAAYDTWHPLIATCTTAGEVAELEAGMLEAGLTEHRYPVLWNELTSRRNRLKIDAAKTSTATLTGQPHQATLS